MESNAANAVEREVRPAVAVAAAAAAGRGEQSEEEAITVDDDRRALPVVDGGSSLTPIPGTIKTARDGTIRVRRQPQQPQQQLQSAAVPGAPCSGGGSSSDGSALPAVEGIVVGRVFPFLGDAESTWANAEETIRTEVGGAYPLRRNNRSKLFRCRDEHARSMPNRWSTVRLECVQAGTPVKTPLTDDCTKRRKTSSKKINCNWKVLLQWPQRSTGPYISRLHLTHDMSLEGEERIDCGEHPPPRVFGNELTTDDVQQQETKLQELVEAGFGTTELHKFLQRGGKRLGEAGRQKVRNIRRKYQKEKAIPAPGDVVVGFAEPPPPPLSAEQQLQQQQQQQQQQQGNNNNNNNNNNDYNSSNHNNSNSSNSNNSNSNNHHHHSIYTTQGLGSRHRCRCRRSHLSLRRTRTSIPTLSGRHQRLRLHPRAPSAEATLTGSTQAQGPRQAAGGGRALLPIWRQRGSPTVSPSERSSLPWHRGCRAATPCTASSRTPEWPRRTPSRWNSSVRAVVAGGRDRYDTESSTLWHTPQTGLPPDDTCARRIASLPVCTCGTNGIESASQIPSHKQERGRERERKSESARSFLTDQPVGVILLMMLVVTGGIESAFFCCVDRAGIKRQATKSRQMASSPLLPAASASRMASASMSYSREV
ncbi:unnamed protein product [Pylaiella littoralis]